MIKNKLKTRFLDEMKSCIKIAKITKEEKLQIKKFTNKEKEIRHWVSINDTLNGVLFKNILIMHAKFYSF